ncbi:MAG: hypothetical protein KF735_02840 [Chelatococcus sp.]|uniref:hypothetical protein n=1 Tax=Chelatococcus sp. TaxID=1953771 RepID=UPI0025C61401|nr:hypothetical protein [Chelatococcus sp.]MBX3536551.1 hypothetical protein [Chelatococcus sp.]
MTGLSLSETTPDTTILDVDLSEVEMTRLSALYIAINTAKDVLAVHCATSGGAVEDLLWFEVERLSFMLAAVQEEATHRLPNDMTERRARADIIARWGLECGQWRWVADGVKAANAA